MSLLFQHFWLLCGLWTGIGGYLYGKYKSKRFIAQGYLNERESNSLLVGYLISILVPSILFWLLSLSIAGSPSPDFSSWPNPQRNFASVLMFSCWALLLYWVFVGTGALKLKRLLMLTSNVPQSWLSPLVIKLFVVILVLVGATSFLTNGI